MMSMDRLQKTNLIIKKTMNKKYCLLPFTTAPFIFNMIRCLWTDYKKAKSKSFIGFGCGGPSPTSRWKIFF